MASGGLGNLTVTLGLDAAEYTRGLTKAELDARKFGEAIGGGIRNAVLGTVAALKALDVASKVPELFQNAVDSVAGYQDLSDKIGDTAANVSRLQKASDVSGVSLDTVAAASVKLTASLSKGGASAQTVSAGLDAIGLSTKAFKSLSPTEQIEAVAKALDGYEDGAGKTAVAVALFGKAGADLLPILHEVADQGGLQVGLTDQQIAAADEYTKAQARMRGEISQFIRVVSVESLPTITAFKGALLESAQEMLGLNTEATKLGQNHEAAAFAESVGRALAFVVDAGDGVLRTFQVIGSALGGLAAAEVAFVSGDAKTALSIVKDIPTQVGEILNRETFSSKFEKKLADLKAKAADATPGPKKPVIDTSRLAAADPAAAAEQKKVLENALKGIEAQVKREQEALQTRNRMLDLQNGASLISFQEYYDGRRQALADAVAKESALYDQEIAVLQRARDAAAKGADREEAQGKINDLLEKKAKLQRDAANEGVALGFQETKSYLDLQRALDGVNASILEYQGRARDAAALRFDSSNADLKKRLEAQGDIGGLASLGDLRSKTLAQAEYNDESTKASDILARLQVAEQRVNTAQQLGTISEVDGLTSLGRLRASAVSQLESIVAAEEAIAKASGTPRLTLQAEKARAALEQLRATADPLGDKLREIFTTGFGDAFADFITGSKSASEAFRSFGQTVIAQLARIAAQSVASNIFGAASGGSSGGSFFGLLGSVASLFGGTGAVASTASALPGDSLDNFLKLKGLAGSRAVYGGVGPDSLYRVNEQEPEVYSMNGRSYLMTGGTSGSIKPLGSAGADGGAGGLSLTMVNHAGVPLTMGSAQRISDTEYKMIVDDARRAAVAEINAGLRDPGSAQGKAITNTYSIPRKF